jgi:hypothetical protein
VNAADAFDIGSFDEEDTKGIKVGRVSWNLTVSAVGHNSHMAQLALCCCSMLLMSGQQTHSMGV